MTSLAPPGDGVLATGDFDFVAALVRDRAAIVLGEEKSYLVESRLAPVARSEGLPSVAALVTALRSASSRGPLADAVVEAMTTNETYFFRDVHPFQALERRILPELMRRRAASRTLTFWCAACSSGQEPYSVALLLRERFAELQSWNVRIIATDISAEMLGRAAAATYTAMEVGRGLPPPLLARHFRRVGEQWQLSAEIRSMVELRTINLAAPWPFVPAVDVLLLRNVLIYFDLAVKRGILRQVRSVLREDGYLFLGGAETTVGIDDTFRRELVGATPCYRPEPQTPQTPMERGS